MRTEVLADTTTLLVRRMVLEPGEATPWHTDLCRRFSVVVRGRRLHINFRDGGTPIVLRLTPGDAEWDEPTDRVHRAVNTGTDPFEEIVTFFRNGTRQDPQPVAD